MPIETYQCSPTDSRYNNLISATYGLLLPFYVMSGIIIANSVISWYLVVFLVSYIELMSCICYTQLINLYLCFVSPFLVIF